MSRKKYVIATDIDHTILHNGYIHEDVKELLKKLSNYSHIAFVTGRRKSSYNKIKTGIEDIVSLENGCIIEIYGKRDLDWERNFLEYYDQKKVFEFLRKQIPEEYMDKKEHMIMIKYDGNDLENLKNKLENLEDAKYLINHNTRIIEVVPKTIDKGEAVKRISQIVYIPLDYFFGLGDSGNDYEMLNIVKKPYTFEHASDEIKELVERKGGYISPYKSHDAALDVLDRIYYEVKKSEI